MSTRNIEAQIQVNDNVHRNKRINLDQQAAIEEIGTIPDAVKPYISVVEYGDNLAHRTVLSCVDLPISFSDDAGVAQYGGVKIYTLPEGLIFSKGCPAGFQKSGPNDSSRVPPSGGPNVHQVQ